MGKRRGPPCEGLTELFFTAGTGDDADGKALARARHLCRSCPIRTQCYWGAVERREPAGVWGGVLFPDAWKRGMRRLRQEVFELRTMERLRGGLRSPAGLAGPEPDVPDVRSA